MPPAPSTAGGQDTHRALAFRENSLRQNSPSWKGSKVDGTIRYSPGVSCSRPDTSRRLAWVLERMQG